MYATCMYVCTHVCMCLCMYVCMHICMYIYIYVWMYASQVPAVRITPLLHLWDVVPRSHVQIRTMKRMVSFTLRCPWDSLPRLSQGHLECKRSEPRWHCTFETWFHTPRYRFGPWNGWFLVLWDSVSRPSQGQMVRITLWNKRFPYDLETQSTVLACVSSP